MARSKTSSGRKIGPITIGRSKKKTTSKKRKTTKKKKLTPAQERRRHLRGLAFLFIILAAVAADQVREAVGNIDGGQAPTVTQTTTDTPPARPLAGASAVTPSSESE